MHVIWPVAVRSAHLGSWAQAAPPEFDKFFASFRISGAGDAGPGEVPPELIPVPAAIFRFAEPVNGKQILTALREV